MKYLKSSLFAALMVLTSNVFAQDKTDSVKVYGNCGMCQKRIEKAAKVDGVIKASWNVDSKVMAVTYDQSKTNLDKIEKSVTAVGHDTQKYSAENAVYDKLPGCCQYDRKARNE